MANFKQLKIINRCCRGVKIDFIHRYKDMCTQYSFLFLKIKGVLQ